jgi:hypothetical protein
MRANGTVQISIERAAITVAEEQAMNTQSDVARPRARSPKVGLLLPAGEQMLGGGTARWEDLLALARRAEELGFDSLWLVDHVLYEYGNTKDIGMWEC